MNTEYYEKTHKWPKGFKKRLCEFYNLKNLGIFNYKGHLTVYRCAFCGSTNAVSAHHYSQHRGIRAIYIDPVTKKVDFKDFSKYIPLCRSCHGTIHTQYGEIYSKGASPLLQFLWQYMEAVHGENGYWNKEAELKANQSRPVIPISRSILYNESEEDIRKEAIK